MTDKEKLLQHKLGIATEYLWEIWCGLRKTKAPEADLAGDALRQLGFEKQMKQYEEQNP